MEGTYHIKNDIVCQDSHSIIKVNDNIVVAAVADGLGSADYSDVASRLAADISTEYCKENLNLQGTVDEILAIIKTSYTNALRAIEERAKSENHDLEHYDTTLSLALLIDNTLYYGHSGDSGIVALTVDGTYEKVTEQQRDEDNRVFPLFFKDRWEFGLFEHKVCSVFLATDGMLEPLFPFLIKNEPVSIYVSLARYFMDNRALNIDNNGEDSVKTRIEEFIKNIPDEQINDDKTVVVLINTSKESTIQPEEYYKEPDWVVLKRKHDEEWKRLAYPHLFKDEKPEPETEQESQQTQNETDNIGDWQ
jgi:serine/threonine protein phosphatase PrpC